MATPPASAPFLESFSKRLSNMLAKPKLDVQVCDHCNLRCAGCLHFAPLAEERFLDLEAYRRDLAQLAAVEGVGSYFGAIALMGGEPLLHPRIAEVVRTTRTHLPDANIALCTNGLLLRRMDNDFWDALVACDTILVISPYPLSIDYDTLSSLAHAKGVRVDFANDITHTCEGKGAFIRLSLDPEGRCSSSQSFISCPFGGCFLQLARGAIWPCQVTAYHGIFARRFGYDMSDGPDDSLPLDSISSTNDIESFRRRPHPMCRYCNSEALTVAPWERSSFAAEEWLAKRG